MKKLIKKVFSALFLIGLGFVICGCCSKYKQSQNVRVVKETGIVEETNRVTLNEIEGKLKEIDQAVFYSDEWIVSRGEEWQKQIPSNIPLVGGVNIPFTKSTISLNCPGVTKVGYNMEDVTLEMDDETNRIYIGLSDPLVVANYVKLGEITGEEHEAFFNSIDGKKYQSLISGIEEEGLRHAEENGIYKAAEKHAKSVIKNTLSNLCDYEVVFM